MPIEAASSIRAAAADEREAARISAHELAIARAWFRRDQRVEQARASEAARSTPAERAAEPARSRSPSSALLLDVLA